MNERTERPAIDIEALLTPISVERPAGESLRYEGTYDRIREARREDDPDLPQGVWQTSLKRADWDTVASICMEALETRSKDLQIAAWLMEAWLHLYGFAGVREGVALLRRLCEAFWEGLYPEIVDEDVEHRIGPIDWVNEKLSIQLKRIPITQPHRGDVDAYSWADWETATHLENLAKRDIDILKSADAEGKTTLARFRGSVMLTEKAFYMGLFEDLSDVLDAVVELERLMEEKCGSRGPSQYQFKEVTTQIQHMVSNILREREEEEVEAAEEEADEDAMVLPSEEKRPFGGGPVRSRAEAYQRLAEIADYLLSVEPHSPAPYLIRRAVAWGSMSLMELLQELVQDKQDLRSIYSLLGIQEGGGA